MIYDQIQQRPANRPAYQNKAVAASAQAKAFEDSCLAIEQAVRERGPWATAVRLSKSFLGDNR